jgi:hypothetical protein
VPLSDAERAALEEIEQQLTAGRPRPRRTGGLRTSVIAATTVFLAALAAYSVLVGNVVPALLALPVAAAALLSLHLAAAASRWAPPVDRTREPEPPADPPPFLPY